MQRSLYAKNQIVNAIEAGNKLDKKGKDHNPNETWENIYHKNMIKLAFMVLLYVYSNDDDKITKDEFKRIKKLSKQEKKHLNQKDMIEINELANVKMTLTSFLDYINKNEYKESIFNESCNVASKIINGKSKYLNILNDLKEKFKTTNL